MFVDTEVAAPWTEDTVRQCLFLYLSLLPLNHRLVHELASVYTEAIADIKRSVLRAIEQPVSHCTVGQNTELNTRFSGYEGQKQLHVLGQKLH